MEDLRKDFLKALKKTKEKLAEREHIKLQFCCPKKNLGNMLRISCTKKYRNLLTGHYIEYELLIKVMLNLQKKIKGLEKGNKTLIEFLKNQEKIKSRLMFREKLKRLLKHVKGLYQIQKFYQEKKLINKKRQNCQKLANNKLILRLRVNTFETIKKLKFIKSIFLKYNSDNK